MPERDTTVVVIYGGANTEHEVSLSSARDVVDTLRGIGFVVRPIGIDRSGVWHAAEVDALVAGTPPAASASGRSPLPGPRPELWRGADVVFPVLHGRYGEDGTVQGALELAGLPYIGSGVLASAIAMDKRMTWRVVPAAGVPMVETRAVDDLGAVPAAVRGWSLPLFVKPNRAGSSVGATRVDDLGDLAPAVRTALTHDRVALIQPAVLADEVSVGVYRTPAGEATVTGASLVELSGSSTFFDYADKYGGGTTTIRIPADIDPSVVERLKRFALAAFEAIDAEGLARIDFFVTPSGEVLLNEINTLPGLTAHSHFPRLCAADGLDYVTLLGMLVERAIAVGRR
ncbi:D-alanine--D-alanine ligase family protein [Leifsonia poae]|uniref:D-alanine--D-alanine ligase family protein n=1 Tax=Leifsonia poae TaxID=110933 RepID=UPI001CBEE6A0|nr:D-alanine--D-alanine ligase family protein [Leifsonia poae]